MCALNAPGSRLPVSNDRSSRTTRCMIVSTLCQTTVWPTGIVAGFGENDWDPLTATTSIMTTDPDAGDGVLGLEELPELLQPQAPRLRTAAASPTEYFRTTISFSFCDS